MLTRALSLFRLLPIVGVVLAGGLGASRAHVDARDDARRGEFNDSHFHLTKYIQQGIDARQFLRIMGRRVGRSTLFGIPLQQEWSFGNSGDYAPTYYLQSDARSRSPTRTSPARTGRCRRPNGIGSIR